jgi:hypothetical protein
MADCLDALVQDIVSNCTTQGTGGIEPDHAWITQRSSISPVYDATNPSIVTGFSMASTTKLWSIFGVKKSLDAGHSLVAADNKADTYVHNFDFQANQLDADTSYAIDNINDVVVIYERKDKTIDGDGVFIMKGLAKGLYKSADDQTENAELGSRVLSLASLGGQEEPVSKNTLFLTDYATTKALLIAAETPAA